MDLLQCPGCRQRFIVNTAGSGSHWRCSRCCCELELVASSIPGPADQIASVLCAEFLDGESQLTGEAPRLEGEV